MSAQIQYRHVGDTQVAIAAQLVRPGGTPVDLTSLTVKFKMVTNAGVSKVAETANNVTVSNAAAGQCEYAPQAADVNTAGTFYAYFTTLDGSNRVDTFPCVNGDLRIAIKADS